VSLLSSEEEEEEDAMVDIVPLLRGAGGGSGSAQNGGTGSGGGGRACASCAGGSGFVRSGATGGLGGAAGHKQPPVQQPAVPATKVLIGFDLVKPDFDLVSCAISVHALLQHVPCDRLPCVLLLALLLTFCCALRWCRRCVNLRNGSGRVSKGDGDPGRCQVGLTPVAVNPLSSCQLLSQLPVIGGQLVLRPGCPTLGLWPCCSSRSLLFGAFCSELSIAEWLASWLTSWLAGWLTKAYWRSFISRMLAKDRTSPKVLRCLPSAMDTLIAPCRPHNLVKITRPLKDVHAQALCSMDNGISRTMTNMPCSSCIHSIAHEEMHSESHLHAHT
jgi:hypothetical protein